MEVLAAQISALVYSELPGVSLELVSAAKKLGAGTIGVAALLSSGADSRVADLSVDGVNTIYKVVDEALSSYFSEPVVDALEVICNQAKPAIVLIGATKRGKEVAPRLATRLKLGCITDVTKLSLSSDSIQAERLVWGGNAVASVVSKGSAVVTVPLRANEPTRGTSQPKIVEINAKLNPSKLKLVGKKEKPQGTASIKDAEIIVSAGRGFKKKEDLALLDGLAKSLNAVIGASRPLTSDLGWMPEERQVGLSGTTVKPKLYVAVGISGQIQHLTGMRDSKLVVAINSDKNAPIFQECDYGIVGDLYAVVPELEKALKAHLGR